MQMDQHDPSDIVTCLERSVQQRSEHCAITFGAQRLSFAELGAAVSSCIDSLRASIPHCRMVGLHFGRAPEYVIAYLALAALGVLIVPFDDDGADSEIAAEARILGIDAIVTNRDIDVASRMPVLRVRATNPDGGPIPWVTSASFAGRMRTTVLLSLIHISEPTRLGMISYAVFCLK